MALINKQDLPNYIPGFSINVGDNEFDPHVLKAEQEDLKPYLPSELFAALSQLQHNSPVSELKNFWFDYVKPIMAYATAYHLLLWHGVNITAFGVRQMYESTSEEILGERRTQAMNYCEKSKFIRINSLKQRLSEVNYTLDGTTYSASEIVKTKPAGPRFKIRGI